MFDVSKTDTSKAVYIRAFCGGHHPGSVQVIHLFHTKNDAQAAAYQSQITDEFDHAFVYISLPNTAWITCRNKAGEIQFCGSGAYALAWLMLNDGTSTNAYIHSDYHVLTAQFNNKHCYLTIPNIHPQQMNVLGYEHMFVDMQSGIYLLKLTYLPQLADTLWLQSQIQRLNQHDIHGFCAFYWDRNLNQGQLRYFVPWHGRDEDYVTGSIQQYLTPLVHQLYGVKTQHWQQVSSSSGSLITEYTPAHVRISGQCHVIENK